MPGFFLLYSGALWGKVGKSAFFFSIAAKVGAKPPDEQIAYLQRLKGGNSVMFSGVSSLNLDSKGRLAIPAKHRDTLLAQAQGKLIITADPAGCLLVYPEPAWLPIRDQLNQLTGAKANIRRFIVGQAEEVEMDASGRVLVPPRLRQVAKLDKEVALVGMGNKFELWDDASWIATTEAIMAMDAQELENNMEGILL